MPGSRRAPRLYPALALDIPASALHNTQVYRRCKLPLPLSISDYCCYLVSDEERPVTVSQFAVAPFNYCCSAGYTGTLLQLPVVLG